MNAMITCTGCLEATPESGFYTYKTGPRSGLRIGLKCKSCTRARSLARSRGNAERNRQQARAWREANRERARERDREYRARIMADPDTRSLRNVRERERRAGDPDRQRELYVAQYARTKDRWNARTRAWGTAHPEKRAEYTARRRALINASPVVENVDRLEIIARDGSRCHICGKTCRPNEIHLDHLVPLSKGGEHSARNLAVAHATCNMRRQAGRIPAQLRLIG